MSSMSVTTEILAKSSGDACTFMCKVLIRSKQLLGVFVQWSPTAKTYLEEEAGDFFHGWVWLSKAETFKLARRATGREELYCG